MVKSAATLKVWVPPGVAYLVSPGVQVAVMRAPQLSPHEAPQPRIEPVPARTKQAPDWTDRPAQPKRPERSEGLPLPERSEQPSLPTGLSVPPELEAAARQVGASYGMHIIDMRLMATKPELGGAIWRITTDQGMRSLKILHREPDRSLFSIGAQVYLKKQGARVPALLPASDGKPYVMHDDKLWIATEWIDSLRPAAKEGLEGAAQLCYGLGEFHRLSKGYVPPPDAIRASRLFRWPKTYQKIATKIGWFREIARAYTDMPASRLLGTLVSTFERQAQTGIERLARSSYADLVARGEPFWGIVHQDYGWSNGQLGPGGVWIIDLDGVSYDLPIRDLRKLIAGVMDDLGAWDSTLIAGMIDAYHQANPIEPALYELLLIDLAMPNEFYKHVKEILYDPRLLDEALERLLRRIEQAESTKWEALRSLNGGWGGNAT